MLKVMRNFNCDVCKGKHFSCDASPCQQPQNLFGYFPVCQGELTFPLGEVSSFGATVRLLLELALLIEVFSQSFVF